MRILLRIVVVLVVLALVVWFGGRCFLARSVAQYEGNVRTKVAAPVEIMFDARGVPQVWAKTDADAYFAIGWLHGSERLFQMELVRRLAAASSPKSSATPRTTPMPSSAASDSRAPRKAHNSRSRRAR